MTKRGSIFILSILMLLLLILGVKPHLDLLKIGYNAYLESATDTFIAYGDYLERLNPKLELALNGKIESAKAEFGTPEKVINDYWRDSYQTSKLSKDTSFNQFERLYADLDKVMKEMLRDGKISDSEQHYIKSLMAYTAELAPKHQAISGDVKTDGYIDYEKTKVLAKQIPNKYRLFAKEADQLLNQEKYLFMLEYQGDFSDVAFESIQTRVIDLFGKLETGRTLISDNRSDTNTDTFVFDTDMKPTNILEDHSLPSDKVSYSVFYNKRTKMIDISAVRYATGSADKLLAEADAEKMAERLSKSIDSTAVLTSKKTMKSKNGKIFEGYRYIYQLDNQGATTEQQQLKIEIGQTGILTQVTLWDSKI